jgi:hypothetical protein
MITLTSGRRVMVRLNAVFERRLPRTGWRQDRDYKIHAKVCRQNPLQNAGLSA